MKIRNFHLAGAVFALAAGTLLHFTYGLSGGSTAVGLFSAVNESVWEHQKLFFVPILVFSIVEYFAYGKNMRNFVPVRVLSIFLGMTFIIIMFYAYVSIAGRHILAVDIGLFVSGVLLAYAFSYKMLQTDRLASDRANALAVIGLALLLVCTVIFTFSPPHAAPFSDPETGRYGISGK